MPGHACTEARYRADPAWVTHSLGLREAPPQAGCCSTWRWVEQHLALGRALPALGCRPDLPRAASRPAGTAVVTGEIADGDTTDAAKAAWRSAVTQGTASRAVALALLAALKALVLSTYARDPKVFGDFGFEIPELPGKVPAAEKAVATTPPARRSATPCIGRCPRLVNVGLDQ